MTAGASVAGAPAGDVAPSPGERLAAGEDGSPIPEPPPLSAGVAIPAAAPPLLIDAPPAPAEQADVPGPSVDEVPLFTSPRAALGSDGGSSLSQGTGEERLRLVMALIVVNILWILATWDRLFGGGVRPVRGIGRWNERRVGPPPEL